MDIWLYMLAYIIGCGVLIHIVMKVIRHFGRDPDD